MGLFRSEGEERAASILKLSKLVLCQRTHVIRMNCGEKPGTAESRDAGIFVCGFLDTMTGKPLCAVSELNAGVDVQVEGEKNQRVTVRDPVIFCGTDQ